MKVYIGHDEREARATTVARHSLYRTSGLHAEVLSIDRLQAYGLFSRLTDTRGKRYDLISNANQSTEFSLTRFLVPVLCQGGWALFTDSDVVFARPLEEMMSHADERYAVMVVKHEHHPTATSKMDGQAQTSYPRKNWSSVMLFNCSHPSNARLTIHDVNTRTGLYLHRFGWLHDSEIGELPREWNWLVNEQPKPANPGIIHFTNGGLFTPGWPGAPYDELWQAAADS